MPPTLRKRRSEVRAVEENEDSEDHHCPLCDQPDSADRFMVLCQKCNRWCHFRCAGVDKSVKNRDFVCELCVPRQQPDDLESVSEVSTTSSMRSRRNLELQRLAEEKAIQEKLLHEKAANEAAFQQRMAREELERQEKLRQEKLQLEKDYLAKKYEVLESELNEESDNRSVQSKKSWRRAIQGWILENYEATLEAGIGNTNSTTTSTANLGAIPKIKPIATTSSQNINVSPANPPTIISSSVSTDNAGIAQAVNYPTPSSTPQPNPAASEAISPLTEQQKLLVDKKRLQTQVRELQQQLQHFQAMQQQRTANKNKHPNPASAATMPLPLIQSLPTLPAPVTSQSSLPTTSNSVTRARLSTSTTLGLGPPLSLPVTSQSSMPITSNSRVSNSLVPASVAKTTTTTRLGLGQQASLPSFPMIFTTTPNKSVDQTHASTYTTSAIFPASNPVSLTTYPTPIVTPAQGQGPQLPPSYNGTLGPNHQQLAARHVVPKELPTFDGDPGDWPLFYSTYMNSTLMCGYSEAENLMRLNRCLKGKAFKAVKSFLIHPNCVPLVIENLRDIFGREELIVEALLDQVRSVPTPKAGDFGGLRDFGLEVQNLCRMLRSLRMEDHLGNPTLLKALEAKLPADVKMKWALSQPELEKVDLGAFGDFMTPIVTAANRLASANASYSKSDKQKREKAYLNAHNTEETQNSTPAGKKVAETKGKPGDNKRDQPRPCLVCKKEGHRVKECTVFKGFKLSEKWNQAQQLKLCRRCLGRHGTYPCRGPVCGFDGCEQRHHKLLHPGNPDDPESTSSASQTPATIAVHRDKPRSTLFRVVPVILHGPDSSVKTLAFLDDGSSLTLIEEDLASQLGIEGETRPLCLQWTGDISRAEADSQRINLEISGTSNSKKFVLDGVQTVKSLDLPRQSLKVDDIVRQYPYLDRLPIRSYQDEVPRILIGLDNTHLLTSLKRREGRPQEPVATKTRLGWAVYGTVDGLQDWHKHRLLHICSEPSDDSLHNAVNEFFSLENIGVTVVSPVEAEEDQRARKILEETTKRTPSGKFETGLLWRYDQFQLPDSRPMAMHRWKCLERRLAANPELYEKVRQEIKEYQANGYAHKATAAELAEADPDRIWYLPLGVVFNPNKPDTLRLIWDAAAKALGVSLNEMLLKGPDWLIPLFAALFRFRQFQIALIGDIRKMFHQIMVRSQDRSAQRFLFRDDPSLPIETFIMDVVTFGATCSPSSAQFIKNRNAEEWKHEFPDAAEAITKAHYMDDYLDSMHSEEEAVRLALEVKEVHAKAGFEIRGWLSNSPSVIQRVGDSAEKSAKQFTDEKGSERVLGMIWNPKEDVFTFALKHREPILPIINGEVVPTKRDALRLVMSIFDPLGLVALVVIHGKCLIQDIWRAKIGWNTKMPADIFLRWQRWLELLRKLEEVKIPRCYFPNYTEGGLETLEIHVFVDASETASACAVYFRITENGNVRCALVASKTKVAPIKLLSIPRLELIAALIGTRLLKTVLENHSFKIKQIVMWTDAVTVLSWVQSDQRKYSRFVAFRISEILESTDIKDWRWVPSRLNVADDATKWKKGLQLQHNSRWFVGPEFLYEPESKWPIRDLPPADTSEEMRPFVSHHRRLPEPVLPYTRFSKWERLLRTVAYALRFIDRLRKVPRGDCEEVGGLSRKELQKAERTLLRAIQQDAYADEIIILQKATAQPSTGYIQMGKSSPLRKLCPFLDADGVLRMEGRIAAAPGVPYESKNPVILPKDHYSTKLLVSWYHKKYGHANGETIYNEIRQQYKIANLRNLIRKLANTCQWCRIYKAKPIVPRMAPLPEERLTSHVRAFTFVGVDFCGPFLIRQGRSLVKRWVMLFTCLTTRALHLEVASALSTESCKLCFRRFIAIRGDPRDIYSDCGTNFQGLSKEANVNMTEIHRTLAKAFTNKDAQWHFNPPAAPHMGGIWERMVRSVKAGLTSIATSRNPDEETFRTYLAEVTAMINSRPLTHVPLETTDAEALTPNHFLMLSSSGVVQPTIAPTDPQSSLRCNWNHIQVMLDQFWTRWIREYLPTINQTPKWFDDIQDEEISVGDLVFIVDEGIRNSWTRGIVSEVIPGADGKIRRAEVQTTGRNSVPRPVVRLALLKVRN